jgi:hypothetical protein
MHKAEPYVQLQKSVSVKFLPSFLLILVLAGVLAAQQRPRINQRVDSTRLTRLGQTTHPLTRTGRDLGRAAADLPMERIQMQLSSSPEQEAALEQLLADQHDPASPHFQEWLTPGAVRRAFRARPAGYRRGCGVASGQRFPGG